MNIERPPRVIGEEASKSHEVRRVTGFLDRYLSGPHILDIGYKGYIADVVPIVPQAIGVELDYPGYDGRTLPFADGSQDAVFASHCLEHIPDFRNALRDWFRVLRVGGFIVVMVPHQFLYEKKVALPSRWNGDHKRFYTPATLMMDVEGSLEPNTYRLRHLVDNDAGFDYALDPSRHSGGAYEIELVIEKIMPPSWRLDGSTARLPEPALEPAPDAAALETPVSTRHAGAQRVAIDRSSGRDLAVYDFSGGPTSPRRILLLKLDHFGDFIIGIPAMRELRTAYPDAHIRLVCGGWNVDAAGATGLFDDVRAYDFFPEDTLGWDGKPAQSLELFRKAAAGRWDIAIDLRVDDDTRLLLEEVDADMRCGIGTRSRMAFLDVMLPPEHADRQNPLSERKPDVNLRPDLFNSRMPVRGAFFHETAFAESNRHLIYGPYIPLPLGRIRITFDVQLDGWRVAMGRLALTLEVARHQSEVVARRVVAATELSGRTVRQVSLEFDNHDEAARYEFRIHASSRPLRGRLRFFGVTVTHLAAAPAPRFRRAELHIGEQLSLLVALVAERSRPLYPDGADLPDGSGSAALAAALSASPSAARLIVIAPVGNSDLRNWPLDAYRALIELLLLRLDCRIVLTGSRRQTGELATVVQRIDHGGRLVNLAGRTSWTDLPSILDAADLVICNNSGVAHLAAARGVRTLSIYSASHQPQEWGPRGARSRAVMAIVGCSPCGHDRLAECPNEHACMRAITPEAIADLAISLLDATDDAGAPTARAAATP